MIRRFPAFCGAVAALLGSALPAVGAPQATMAAGTSAVPARPAATGLSAASTAPFAAAATAVAASPRSTVRPAPLRPIPPAGTVAPPAATAAPVPAAEPAHSDGHGDHNGGGGGSGGDDDDDHHGTNDIDAAFGTPFALAGGNVTVGAAFPNGFEVSFAGPRGTTMTVVQKEPTSTNLPAGWRPFERQSYAISMSPAVQSTRSALRLHYDPKLAKGTDIAIAAFAPADQSWALLQQPPTVDAKFSRVEQSVPSLQGEFLPLIKADAVAPSEGQTDAVSGGAAAAVAPGFLPLLGTLLALQARAVA